MDNTTQETLAQLAKVFAAAPTVDTSRLQKAGWSQPGSTTTGLQGYNLEGPSKKLFPAITPLRNRIPRKTGGFGTAVNWKAITALNSLRVRPGIAQGKRNAFVTTTIAEYNAAYRGLGLEDFVTFEAQYAGQTYEDIRALAAENLLTATMIAEEQVIVGGNTSLALGTPAAPTGVASASGGTMTTRASVVARIVALTLDGWMATNTSDLVTGLTQTIARTNADGTSDTINGGCSIKSAASSAVSVTGNTGSVTWTWTDVRGAVAYAIYTGAAGSEKLAGFSTTNKFVQTADEAGGSQAASALVATDYSQDSLVFDGIITQLSKSGSGAYYLSLDGAVLSANGSAGITQIDTALQWFWDTYRLQPDEIHVNSQEAQNITNKVLAAGATPAFRINIPEGQGQAQVQAGSLVTTYLAKFGAAGAKPINIIVHPNVPPGEMVFISWSVPYRTNNIPSVLQMDIRQEYYAIDWPLTTRQYTMGVYVDEVLKIYAPLACGIIKNIANG